MITKACKQALQSYLTWPATSNPNTNISPFSESIKDSSGNTKWLYYMGDKMIYSTAFSRSKTTSGVIIGTSDTPATDEDYELGELITDSNVIGVVNPVRGVDNNGYPYLILNVTVLNNTDAAITIREIGLISYNARCASTQSGGSAGDTNFLLDRTVLTNPVTLQPGRSTDIEYKIKVNMQFL